MLKVTYLDSGTGSFTVETAAGASPAVSRDGTGQWRTATIALPDGALAARGRWPSLRIALAPGADDLVVRFVRLVRVSAP